MLSLGTMLLIRRILCTGLILISLFASGQQVNLSSFQHELRWLDEDRFPPLLLDGAIRDSLFGIAGRTLQQKFGAAAYSAPEQVDYKLNSAGFGKLKMMPPAASSNPNHYQAAILSLLTRATVGFDVLWQLKIEVRQGGKKVFSGETSHQLIHYGDGAWFTPKSFTETFQMLMQELTELSPPLAKVLVLEGGIDYASLLLENSEAWDLKRNANILGYGQPAFGPFVTLEAGKIDTPVVRINSNLGREDGLMLINGKLFFNQYKISQRTKTRFCKLLLQHGNDTITSLFAIQDSSEEARRTFLSDLLTNDEDNNSQTISSGSKLWGKIRTPESTWEFLLHDFGNDERIDDCIITNGTDTIGLFYDRQDGKATGLGLLLAKDKNGAHLASAKFSMGTPIIRMHKDLPQSLQQAIATFYAIYFSVRFVR